MPLYLAAERWVVERGGNLIAVDDERMRFLDGETTVKRQVRFRTLGCWPLTGAIASAAADVDGVIAELLDARSSERQGRLGRRRPAGLHGTQEEGGIFLMPDTLAPPANDALPLAIRSELRFLTCGSVDDGKSTLIGRLISDAAGLHDDQIASLRDDSRRFGTTEDEFDFALLLDGLEAEREQGITIDVAYRFFSTARRAFVVADTPGHQQYTRNMATGASNAELAILLVDARKGLVEQTRRHAAIVSLLGIRHVVLAVNKIDLVEFSEARFREIEAAFTAFAAPLAFHSVVAIPLSARLGDNVAVRSERTPWYGGPALLAHLETVETDLDAAEAPLRFPVQWVNRPDGEFRGFSGTVASGRVAVGDPIVVSGSGRSSSVARIVSFDGDLSSAAAGRSVTLTLADEVDVIRGDVLADSRHRPAVARRFAADLVWMDETAATPGKRFLLKIGTATVPATLSRIADTLDVESLTRAPATSLVLNAIGRVEIEAAQAVAFDAYAENRQTGAFILIDRSTLRTAAAGMVVESADIGRHVHRHAETVTPALRAEAKGAAAVGRLADRPAGLGQVDHRQHR